MTSSLIKEAASMVEIIIMVSIDRPYFVNQIGFQDIE